jgi:hypothetical protein
MLSIHFADTPPTRLRFKMRKSILLRQFLLPSTAVSLGRFVTNLDNPHQDYHDPTTNTSSGITEKVQENFQSRHDSTNHQDLASQLTKFLSTSFSKRLNTSVQITADKAKTYYLNNTGQWLRDAVKHPETRDWIERTIDEGEDIYVVTAYQTLVNARISEQAGEQSAVRGNVRVPVSDMLAAAGVVDPVGISDPGFGGSRGHSEDGQRHFIVLGEQIYAVQYRKVRWRWFSSKEVDQSILSNKAWWEIYDGPRNLQSEPENMIEVELEDEIHLEEITDEYVMGPKDVLVTKT